MKEDTPEVGEPEPGTAADTESYSILRLLLIGVSITVIIAGLRAATEVITTVFLAFVIAISVSPLLNWLRRRGLPGWLAFSIVFLAVIIIVLLLVIIVFVSIQQFVNVFPTYQDRIAELKQSLRDWLDSTGIGADRVQQLFSLDSFDPQKITSAVTSIATTITSALSGWIFILFVAAVMLFESVRWPDKMKRAIRTTSPMPERLIAFNKHIRSYFILNAWLGFLAAAIETAMLLLLGVDFALLWGVISFLFSFVPYIGFIISFLPPAFIALLQLGLPQAAGVIVGYVLINTVVDNVLTPKVMASGLNLSPLVVVLSVLFWAWVMGPLGAILSVPMTLMVKELILESSDESRWLAALME